MVFVLVPDLADCHTMVEQALAAYAAQPLDEVTLDLSALTADDTRVLAVAGALQLAAHARGGTLEVRGADDSVRATLQRHGFTADGPALAPPDGGLRAARAEAQQLRDAMAHRATIEQAKAILAMRCGGTPDDGFALLVSVSQRSNTKLRTVARLVVEWLSRAPGGGERAIADALELQLSRDALALTSPALTSPALTSPALSAESTTMATAGTVPDGRQSRCAVTPAQPGAGHR